MLPGLGGSGPQHWQTLWQARYGDERVEQRSWDQPDRQAWVSVLAERIARARGPVLLIAHSLACSLVAHWAERHGAGAVAGALLVAPADIDELHPALPEVRSFAPIPLRPLPFASTVLSSSNDPYVSAPRARHFASRWGSAFVDLGPCGHINTESRLGDWPSGRAHLRALARRAGVSIDEAPR